VAVQPSDYRFPLLPAGEFMVKAHRSGIVVTSADVPLILAMVARGDRKHDIAAWFGLNQGRIKDIEDGDHGSPPLAPADQLPPSGSPGPKALDLRRAAARVEQLLAQGDESAIAEALRLLRQAIARFDRME
jgi:hypothetical protein